VRQEAGRRPVNVDKAIATQEDNGRGIRDLMGLLALPALWLGKDGRTVLRLMAQAVERLVPLRFSMVEARILAGDASDAFIRVEGADADPDAVAHWRAASAHWPKTANIAASGGEHTPTPIGPMRVIRLELGVSTLGGGAWFGSDAPDFPTFTQLAVLRAAASLAATGLQAARLEHERAEADRLKDQFLAMLGHELRNPLAPIRAGAALWQAQGVTPDQIRSTGAIMERQVQHMTHLVDDLLDVSRLSTGTVTLDTVPLDLRDVVGLAVEQARSQIDAKRHALLLDLPDAACTVRGDCKRLVQIVVNLLNNAVRYTPPGGRIMLSIHATPTTVGVKVADTGIGIEPAMLGKIFEWFIQVERSTERSDAGLGLGLALARRLAGLHGGTLHAASRGLGHGSEFEVLLPRAQPAVDAAPALPEDAPAASPALKVLVVDDNQDAGITIGMLLEALGHTASVVHHPYAALDLAPSFQPDVFLLDIGLPGIDGYELARRLRALPGLGPFRMIALTGFGQARDQRDAFDAGFDFHCTKPVDIAVLDKIFSGIAARKALAD
jgi:signal transduction histidine kinase/ActR/RegA family two-component response regulator